MCVIYIDIFEKMPGRIEIVVIKCYLWVNICQYMTTFVWFCTSPCWIWRLECQKKCPNWNKTWEQITSPDYIIFPHDLVIKSTFFAGLITVVCWRRDSSWLPLKWSNVLLAHFSLPLKITIFTNETLIQNPFRGLVTSLHE